MKFNLSQLNPFKKTSADVLRLETLEEYARLLLTQEAAAAYHHKMSEFYAEGITRLTLSQIAHQKTLRVA